MRTLTALIQKFATIASKSNLRRAVGESDGADVVRIEHYCMRVGSVYGEMLDWAADVRGMTVDSEVHPLVDLVARMADSPLKTIRQMVDDFVSQAGGVPEFLHGEGDETLTINLVVQFAMDEDLIEAFTAERVRLYGE